MKKKTIKKIKQQFKLEYHRDPNQSELRKQKNALKKNKQSQ